MTSKDEFFTKQSAIIQRIENGAIAAAIFVTVVIVGLPWWVLIALFVVFDRSAIGYLHDPKLGAIGYNLVHNYTAPALLGICYVVLSATGQSFDWLALFAASWAFHVAFDRATGYGLKLNVFNETHLGLIGKDRRRAEG